MHEINDLQKSPLAHTSTRCRHGDRLGVSYALPVTLHQATRGVGLYTGTAVVVFTRSSTKLVLQSCTLGCLSKVSMMKRL